MRFNRYIVECKVIASVVIFISCPDLIDTLWNVKASQASTLASIAEDLIDTLWNVKWYPTTEYTVPQIVI